MGTDIRPETSKKNNYWISKHRYYELLHWCRQYEEWVKERDDLLSTLPTTRYQDGIRSSNQDSYVENIVIKLEKLNSKINMLKNTAFESDTDIYEYIIVSVTKGKGYTYLKEVKGIPCSKNYFYERYRRFFWILSNKIG